MEVSIVHDGKVRFTIKARTHTIVCDQPIDAGGTDEGMTPPELLLASLGSCAAYYAAQYLKSRKLAEAGVRVIVTAEKLKEPARIGKFLVNVVIPVALTEAQKLGMLRSIHQCLIHNTLLSVPGIAIELNSTA